MCAKYKVIHGVCVYFVRKATLSFAKRETLYNCKAKSVWQLPNLFKEVRAVPTSGSVRRFGEEGGREPPQLGLQAEKHTSAQPAPWHPGLTGLGQDLGIWEIFKPSQVC